MSSTQCWMWVMQGCSHRNHPSVGLQQPISDVSIGPRLALSSLIDAVEPFPNPWDDILRSSCMCLYPTCMSDSYKLTPSFLDYFQYCIPLRHSVCPCILLFSLALTNSAYLSQDQTYSLGTQYWHNSLWVCGGNAHYYIWHDWSNSIIPWTEQSKLQLIAITWDVNLASNSPSGSQVACSQTWHIDTHYHFLGFVQICEYALAVKLVGFSLITSDHTALQSSELNIASWWIEISKQLWKTWLTISCQRLSTKLTMQCVRLSYW